MSCETADTIFHCKMCGHCCEGRGGIVLSENDLSSLAAHLGISPADAVEKYAEISNGKTRLRTGNDGYCIFFRQGQGCTVHEGKPAICKAWPFFKGNIIDASSLDLAKDFCPGIQSNVSHATFAKAGMDYLMKHELLAHDAEHEANALIFE